MRRSAVYLRIDGAAARLAGALIPLDSSCLPRPLHFALVIPTLREAAALPAVLDRTMAALARIPIPWEIVVVDDDSGDGASEIVSRIARREPRVRLLVRQSRRGLSGAILHGWRHSSASILGVMDADLQHPPEVLPLLVETILEGRDLAIGSRYVKGAVLDGWSLPRRLLSSASVRLTWPLLADGLRPRDPLSGFFLVRRTCVEGLGFRGSGFKLLLEILVRGRVRTVSEVPIVFGARASGRSKAGVRVALDYVRLLGALHAGRMGLSSRAMHDRPLTSGDLAPSAHAKVMAEG